MSRFFSSRFSSLEAYTPGEQPQNRRYVKLNTNESPFPPPEEVIKAAETAGKNLQLYSDPECKTLIKALAGYYGFNEDEIITGNGSDELLNFAFMAFCDENHKAIFPQVSYGFYPVFANVNNLPYKEIPLRDDFTINCEDYINEDGTVIIANPNAPTGIALTCEQIESIVKSNPDRVTVIDEAYVDFGAQSAAELVHKYSNLLVIQTYSKSRSLAGARLGYAIGQKELIADLNTIKYSTNPYNINSMTMAAGAAAIENQAYFDKNCAVIIKNREYLTEKLTALGFSVLPSKANFVFAKADFISGKELYLSLKEAGVLIRHFDKELIADYNRITVGTKEQLDILIAEITKIRRNK